MRWLKWIVAVIVLLVAGFLSLGWFVPVVEYEVSVDVEASRTESFAVFADVSRMGEWLEGFQTIENISGAPGQVGSRWRLTFADEQGQPIVIEEEVTAYVPAERVAFVMDSDFALTQSETRFETAGEGSRIIMSARIQGKGWVWRSLMALSKKAIEVRSATDLGRLKRMIEAETGA